ncbi:beta-galactosidase trimerization domain-containing protein [Paenibacillus macerans]|uniref:beta-galactosidase trimerization domain-containing protein n=1 Tax=Paenibacillus macerans TaxID=44252 RepID=UPI002DBFAE24|nr:beta-galactosidase trimerization domain-containing protein [Paenibacillus macerans]MEC0332770.1 beta-galactosidase trimerization domain-containing protein [Paenibacillus macerans]
MKHTFNVPDLKKIRLIVNSDAKNEADDQYAIVHALLSPQLIMKGLIGAHFGEERSQTSMMDSVKEIELLLDLMGLSGEYPVFCGAERAVEGGGLLVLGCRSGYKDMTGQCYMLPFPGPLADLCGIEVEDFTLIGPLQQAPDIQWEGGAVLKGDTFADILRVTSDSAEVLAAYASEYYAGKPALVRCKRGEGSSYYYGSVFTEAVAGALLDEIGLTSPAAEWAELPEDVELAIRTHEKTQKSYAFLMNYAHTEQTVVFRSPKRDLLTEKVLQGGFPMQPFEVCVIELS